VSTALACSRALFRTSGVLVTQCQTAAESCDISLGWSSQSVSHDDVTVVAAAVTGS